ncbi:uncharacterized protein LODBEIA_P08850 [Lodderomyces beijingensis]|uniref:Signal recognition particle SEC65 subunit n=1 Tax=Lodderomyces beijingensis TaxID=1775926 RepID=A0ABP0ZIK9_9ASCO
MSRRPVLEEVNDDDIDNLDMDLAQFDPSLKTPVAPRRPEPTIVRSQDQNPEPAGLSGVFPGMPNFSNVPPPPQPSSKVGAHKQANIIDPNAFTEDQKAHFRKFQILYPCYFDLNRSHKQGRRVSIDRAVENPLAKTISDACRHLQVPVLLELDKTHPQDFGNPGRVRVLLKDEEDGGKPLFERFNNKKRFMNEIANYLADHPTDLDSIGVKSGIAMPQDFQQNFTPEEIPKVKGFKMNTIVPVHSSLTLKHPMTKSIYDPEPAQDALGSGEHKPNVPKAPKKKIMKIRG